MSFASGKGVSSDAQIELDDIMMAINMVAEIDANDFITFPPILGSPLAVSLFHRFCQE